MSVLAIHPGDLHLRAAYLDRLNAPTAVEDENETQSFVTPSLVTVDDGGASFGHSALEVAAEARVGTVRWRYRRAALATREVLANDRRGLGLTSEAFAALAVKHIANEARAWASDRPALAVVVPADLPGEVLMRLRNLAGDAAGQPVALVDEADALAATLPGEPPRDLIAVSVDDDATRLRLLRGGVSLGERTFADLGLADLRRNWLARWNGDCARVLGAEGFGDGDNAEFERLWLDLWEVLNADPRFKVPVPTWPLIRQSALLPMTAPREALRLDIDCLADRIAAAVLSAVADAGGDGLAASAALVVVGEPAVTRRLVDQLSRRWAIPVERCHVRSPAAYAAGATRLLAGGRLRPADGLDAAPWTLGVLGMSRDDTNLSFRPLIAAGSPLPATASFSVMANRDAQKRLALSLARQEQAQGQPVVNQRFEFGPLLGQGMQKLKITVQWTAAGRIEASAADAENGRAVPCSSWSDIVGGTPVLGAQHLTEFE